MPIFYDLGHVLMVLVYKSLIVWYNNGIVMSKNDYISLTDIARDKRNEPNDVIKNGWEEKIILNFLVYGKN